MGKVKLALDNRKVHCHIYGSEMDKETLSSLLYVKVPAGKLLGGGNAKSPLDLREMSLGAAMTLADQRLNVCRENNQALTTEAPIAILIDMHGMSDADNLDKLEKLLRVGRSIAIHVCVLSKESFPRHMEELMDLQYLTSDCYKSLESYGRSCDKGYIGLLKYITNFTGTVHAHKTLAAFQLMDKHKVVVDWCGVNVVSLSALRAYGKEIHGKHFMTHITEITNVNLREEWAHMIQLGEQDYLSMRKGRNQKSLA